MAHDHTAGKHILVVDDDFAIRLAITRILENSGYTVSTAANGQEALDLLHNMPSLPSKILLDLNMPIMTGWEFRMYQKYNPRIAHIPVIIISADRSIEQQPFDIDAVGYFTKPLDYQRLLTLLAT